MAIETVILDLDGPLLDGRLRHYACYRGIMEQLGYRPLPMRQYWKMKRNGVNARELLAANSAERRYGEFRAQWLRQIEAPKLLALDVLQPEVKRHLYGWRRRGLRIVLATLRQRPEGVRHQLRRLGIERYFDRVLVADYRGGGRVKAEKVMALYPLADPQSILWIGDTEVDFVAARHLTCRCLLVTSGVRSRSYLRGLSPDFLKSYLRDVDLERL